MLKNFAVKRITAFLKSFLQDIDTVEIEKMISSGTCVLKNKTLNTKTLLVNDFVPFIPVQVKCATINHIGINIDWANFLKSPIIVAIDGINLLTKSISLESYAEIRGKWAHETMCKEMKFLNSIEQMLTLNGNQMLTLITFGLNCLQFVV